MQRRIAAAMLICLLGGGTQVYAQGRGKGPQKQKAQPSTVAGGSFDKEEERIIRGWFSSPANLKGLPPGLAKREQLPPGLQRQLAKNGKLPPGLEKKVQPLPRELDLQLPRLPDGRKRMIIAGNVVLLEERTATIVDILRDIF